MQEIIQKSVKNSVSVLQQSLTENASQLQAAAEVVIAAFQAGNKLLICGNGGSAADSQHMAAEFIGRFKAERRSLPAVALSTDTSILTALGNDYGFDVIFARQVEGLGQDGDVLLGISTSGNSVNVIKAVEAARNKGMQTISLTGKQGGKLAPLTDIRLIVDCGDTAYIQEAHLCMEHILCDLVEQAFV